MASYHTQGRLYASQATHAAILKLLAELTSPETVHKLMINATPNRSDRAKTSTYPPQHVQEWIDGIEQYQLPIMERLSKPT